MNQEQRNLIRYNLKIAKFKKGKALTKEEGRNILEAHLHTTLKKEKPENFTPRNNDAIQIGSLLTKFKGEQHG